MKKRYGMGILMGVLVLVGLCCGLAGCSDPQPIDCYLDYYNVEEQTWLVKKETASYHDAHVTYDGKEKSLFPTVRVWRDDRPLDILRSYTQKVVPIDPETGELSESSASMKEVGKYAYTLENLEYDTRSFRIRDWSDRPVTVYVQDGRHRTYACDQTYSVDIAAGFTQNVMVTAEHAGLHTVRAEGASIRVFDAEGEQLAAAQDAVTVMMGADKTYTAEFAATEAAVHTSGGVFFTPEKLQIGESVPFELGARQECTYEYNGSESDALFLPETNPKVGMTWYDADWRLVQARDDDGLHFFHTANKPGYIKISNSTDAAQSGELIVRREEEIKVNRPTQTEVRSAARWLPFAVPYSGAYSLTCSDDRVQAESVDEKNEAVREFAAGQKYFVRVAAEGNLQKEITVTVEYTPSVAVFGSNDTEKGQFVRFFTPSDETFTFANVTAIYDYALNPVDFSDGKVRLAGSDKGYYLQCGDGIAEIGVACKNLPLGVPQTDTADEYGELYYRIDNLVLSDYIVTTAADGIKIYSDHFRPQHSAQSGRAFGMTVGRYYVKFVTQPHQTVSTTLDRAEEDKKIDPVYLPQGETVSLPYASQRAGNYWLYMTSWSDVTIEVRLYEQDGQTEVPVQLVYESLDKDRHRYEAELAADKEYVWSIRYTEGDWDHCYAFPRVVPSAENVAVKIARKGSTDFRNDITEVKPGEEFELQLLCDNGILVNNTWTELGNGWSKVGILDGCRLTIPDKTGETLYILVSYLGHYYSLDLKIVG